MDIKDVNDFNLQTKELGCNYWSTYTKSGIEGVLVTSLHHDSIGVDNSVTNFIQPYLHQFFDDSHSLNGYGKPLKRPFNRYQSCLEAISIGRDIRQINW